MNNFMRARLVLGVFLLIVGFSYSRLSAISGFVVLIGAFIVIPYTGSKLEHYLPSISRHGTAIGYGFGLFFLGLILLITTGPHESNTQATSVSTIAEPIKNQKIQTPVIPENAPIPLPIKPEINLNSKYSADGMMLIEGEGWDEMRNNWGKTWIKRINETMPLAMQKAAASSECDFAEIAGISDRSTARKEMIFFVDCRNGKRFFISQNDLKSDTAVVSKNAKTAAIDDTTAIQACEQSVKKQLNFPLSFTRHWTVTAVHRAPTGNIAVEFIFDAKNALGAELPQRARCIIDDEGIQPAEISVQ